MLLHIHFNLPRKWEGDNIHTSQEEVCIDVVNIFIVKDPQSKKRVVPTIYGCKPRINYIDIISRS